MFKLCSGSTRMLLGKSKRPALGFRLQYSLFCFLIPSHRTWRVCPAMFRFKEAHCGIESEPIAIWCMRPQGLHVNLVEHDVDVKMLFVVVCNDHELMAFISERLHRVKRAHWPAP